MVIGLGALAYAVQAQPFSFRQELAAAARAPHSTRSLKLFVECRRQNSLVSLETFVNGTSIWNNERQFTLDQTAIARLVRTLHAADFAAMKDVYGGTSAATPKEPEDRATVSTCRISVALNGREKESVQLNKGEQSQALKTLAENLLKIAEGRAAGGVRAASLRDGFAKIASGKLAPEASTIMVHRKPEGEGTSRRRGFLLQVSGLSATSQPYDPQKGYGDEVVGPVTPAVIRRLARDIAARAPDNWPVTFYAQDYTDLTLRVLNRKRSIQARQFAGMRPEERGSRQADFDAVLTALERLNTELAGKARRP